MRAGPWEEDPARPAGTIRARWRGGSRGRSSGAGRGAGRAGSPRRSARTRPGHRGEVREVLGRDRVAEARCDASRRHRSRPAALVARSGRGLHTARATGRRGSGCGGSITSTTVATSRKRVPMSTIEAATAWPGCASNTSRTGSALPPIDSGWTSRRGRPRGDRLADLEHVRPEAEVPVGGQVVRVVLHERDAARQAARHDLHGADHRRGLPVALGAEAVAVAHQPLDGEARQLGHAVEVLEGRGERREPAGVEEAAQADLDPRPVAQRLGALAHRGGGPGRRRIRRGRSRRARRPRHRRSRR